MSLLDRRRFLSDAGGFLGAIPLLQLLHADGALAAPTASGSAPIRPDIDPKRPYAPRTPHAPTKAKRLLVIYLPGAVSHIDTFDYKPELVKFHGKRAPGQPAVTFEGPSGFIAQPFWKFRPRGQSGKMISDLVPNLAELADSLCFFHSLSTKTSAHPQGENFLSTGHTSEGFPSLGAWVSYALGTENQDLPAFVAIPDPRGLPRSARNNWGSGFLPALFQGTDFSVAHPPANLERPRAISADADRRAARMLANLNTHHQKRSPGDGELAARIASYELAGRMQTSIPSLTKVQSEPEHVIRSYGADSKNQLKREYAHNCILARRLIEKGVRCVQLFNGSDAGGGNGITNWDSHADIVKTHAMQAEIMDQPTAALIKDLGQRGLLAETLVVWCTEFGRMPFLQGNGTGRDHNPDGFTCFMTGAGVRQGMSYGATDEWGHKAVEKKASLHDFNATILHLLGLDHLRLTYYHNGLERRLTDVHGDVIKDVLA